MNIEITLNVLHNFQALKFNAKWLVLFLYDSYDHFILIKGHCIVSINPVNTLKKINLICFEEFIYFYYVSLFPWLCL